MPWLALDIGGANLKVSDGHGYADAQPFAMWREHTRLAGALRAAIERAPRCDSLAVTMTGELADCFASRAAGVRWILNAVTTAAAGRPTRVYRVDGRLVPCADAAADPIAVASANWHALASYCARLASEPSALMIDIGSTTVDIIPLADGCPTGRGSTDYERLAAGELVYTGIDRSPVCAVVSELTFEGIRHAVAQEFFATMRDVYLLLGDRPEDPDDRQTADGRPATRADAHRRLARMLCLDADQVSTDVTGQWAGEIALAQLQQLARAARKVLAGFAQGPTTVVISGHGQSLARRLLDELDWAGRTLWLSDRLGESQSRCASAYALAVLARDQFGTAISRDLTS